MHMYVYMYVTYISFVVLHSDSDGDDGVVDDDNENMKEIAMMPMMIIIMIQLPNHIVL